MESCQNQNLSPSQTGKIKPAAFNNNGRQIDIYFFSHSQSTVVVCFRTCIVTDPAQLHTAYDVFLPSTAESHLETALCVFQGNHDLWVRTPQDSARFPDSICKMLALWALCDELGVDIAPAEVTLGVWVAPLFSWYAHTFDVRDPR